MPENKVFEIFDDLSRMFNLKKVVTNRSHRGGYPFLFES